jgi:RNA polymerase sigma-70 factor (ECF subfamily)
MSRHDGYDERFGELSLLGYQVAYRLTGDRAESEDVAQEAMTRAFLRWHRVSGYAEAWVVRVSTNLVIGRWRRIGSRRAHGAGPERAAADPDAAERIALVAALRRLPRRQREVAVLRYLGDLSVEQTATALGLSESAVKAHAARSLVALRRGLDDRAAPDASETSPTDPRPTDPRPTDPAATDPALPRGDR